MTKKIKKLQKARQEKKQALIRHAWIVLAGLIVALGIHFYVIDDSDVSRLKTSVVDIKNQGSQSTLSDLYFEKIDDSSIALKTSKNINNITKLSFSLTFNTEALEINSISPSNSKTRILNLANIPGISTSILEWWRDEQLQAWDTIVTIQTTKLSPAVSTINTIVETIEFSDVANDSYSPTTSWISL